MAHDYDRRKAGRFDWPGEMKHPAWDTSTYHSNVDLDAAVQVMSFNLRYPDDVLPAVGTRERPGDRDKALTLLKQLVVATKRQDAASMARVARGFPDAYAYLVPHDVWQFIQG